MLPELQLFPGAGLLTERLSLRLTSPIYAQGVLDYYTHNKAHLTPWEPARDDDFYTFSGQMQRLTDMAHVMEQGYAVSLLMFPRQSDDVIGICNFSNIVRGAFQACHLGFAIAGQEQGKGLMQEALSAGIYFMFHHYGLHRIMANYRPENHRSGKLLASLGFEVEGKARSYLKINGEWTDHVLTSLINEAMT
ncbi:ribosomal protein S5-alanine N-acetyltransferase [Hahella sp. CR1]|uniref:ribosomal protein S5-alanine N-acetyltransferase n=1 Tax=Hahella sp. CR1 TaxID=2992807 RepID=UPI0024413D72|nr:ribosomal protein S5-alanine N-acetyltransferase [Hahella sp. CR1]MDG9669188.1 ribosomal protein S5-alanine N-acetyltransferase [Hahella sp. CR1]